MPPHHEQAPHESTRKSSDKWQCSKVYADLLEHCDVVVLLNAAPVDAGDGDDEQNGEEDHPNDQSTEIVDDVEVLLQIDGHRRHSLE
ncbi:hypothetical protein Y032_0206g1980 [Ancylostoma ceylanicum]|uniref:Uncharacterized protein n=1 Tax=Ancylostoma ceylanicum TaxID=53326 RepID=A0A016SM70_9BILA|nr:hypothetical protein Y032_0206g1980 [Ancylostoma ceylanicum]